MLITINMTREKKLAIIYDKIANKERSFWCQYLVKHIDNICLRSWTYIAREVEWENISFVDSDTYNCPEWEDHSTTETLISVIWHPITIGDVIQYLQDKYQWHPDGHWCIEFKPDLYSEDTFYANVNSLYGFWENKRERVDVQSNECIDHIYSLIKN